MSYGKITVGVGRPEMRDIEIQDFIQVTLKDNRLISVSQLEDGSMVVAVENPPSSGRSPQSNIWLSKESLIGLLMVVSMYFKIKEEDVDKVLADMTSGKDVQYSCSDNLNVDHIRNRIDGK